MKVLRSLLAAVMVVAALLVWACTVAAGAEDDVRWYQS